MRRGQSERFKRRLTGEPGPRDAQRRNAAKLQQHRAEAIAASRVAMQRPEVRERLQESIARANAERSRQVRRRHDARAREHGYADLRELLVRIGSRYRTVVARSGLQEGRV